MMPRVRALAAIGALVVTVSVPTSARAAVTPVDPQLDGYSVEVKIKFTGEASPGGTGGSTSSHTVSPTCWWQPANDVYTDAAASLDWYKEVTDGGQQTRGNIGEYGPIRIWEAAAKDEKDKKADVAWYRAFCKDPADYVRYNAGSNEDVDPVLGNPENFVTYYYRAFPAGAAVPDPLVDPEELARVARDLMVIPVPETDRNPKVQSAGAPTLVGLPTWFWVTDPESVGGADGDRDITATLGDVFATVTAKTGGLTLKSPAGGATCVPSQALIKYSAGTSEDAACTVEFTRASVAYPGGYPLAASTNWDANWVGSGGTGGPMEGLARNFVSNVPVAEVQNIVTRR